LAPLKCILFQSDLNDFGVHAEHTGLHADDS
jgi:hypothetical protein